MQPEIIYQNDDFFIINKPAGYSVEPHKVVPSVYDWLANSQKFGEITELERGGVVHRIDIETSGLLAWAKNNKSLRRLQELWQGRAVKKSYLALVVGETKKEGTIELAIGRDNKKDRMKASLLPTVSYRPAITNYFRLEVSVLDEKSTKNDRIGKPKSQKTVKGQSVSLLRVEPITGRTHQIRVHLKAIGHSIIGDKLYGDKTNRKITTALEINRHLLHAWKLLIPGYDQFVSKIPADLTDFAKKLNLKLP